MKTLVVYRSHYGSTRRYAQWLAQALDADAAEERQADARLVQNYGISDLIRATAHAREMVK